MRNTVLLLLLCMCTNASEKVWHLLPIDGNNAKGWAITDNWTHKRENPLVDKKAKWTLVAQEEKNPSLTATYTLMKPGLYVGYTKIWQVGPKSKDPAQKYIKRKLTTQPEDKTPHASRASAILFGPNKDGAYQFTIAGTISTQHPSAGHARVTVYVLSKKRAEARELAKSDLNKQASGAYGGFPNTFTFKKSVKLKKDEELAIRLQAVNPGPASVGGTALSFTTFEITRK